jgi:hypothetical protein
VVGAEGPDQGGYRLGAHGVQEAEGDLAGGRVRVGPYLVGGPLDLREGPLDGAQERTAGRGQRDRAATAGEEVHAQVLFEADHRPGQRRLRDLHLLRGPRHVLGAGDPGEVRQARGEQPRHAHDVFCVTGR